MPVNIGPRIGIEGEAQYRKEIQNIIQETKTLKSEMQATSSAWDKHTSAMKKNSETRKNLNQQIDLQKQKVEKMKTMLAESEKKYGENATETQKWRQAVAGATTDLNKMQSELKNLPNNLQIVGDAFKTSGDKIKGVGEAFAPVSAAAAAGIGASVKLASDFEDSMAKVSTIADTTKVPMEDLKKSIMDLSNETGIAAPEIAANIYDAISAGQDTADAVSFVENATTLAKAGFTSSASALDILTTAMNAYGLEADEVTKVSDILITTQNLGKTTVDQLAASMGKVIPTAKANGVDIEQLAASYAVMTSNGIATAETTTYINSMLNELGKKGSSAEKAFRKATSGIKDGGLSMKEAMESGMSLTDVLELLDQQAQKDKTSIANLFGSAEAGKAATVLLDNSQQLTETIAAMGDSAGATQEAFEKLDTTSNTANIALNQIKNAGIEMGTTLLTMLAPAIQSVSEGIQKLSTWFSGLDDSTKKTIATAALVVAAIAPVLVVIGSVVSAVGTIIGAIGAAVPIITSVGTAFAGVVAAAAPFIAIAAAVVAAGVLIYQNWDLIKEKAAELAAKVAEKFQEIKAKATEIFENIKTTVSEKVNALKETVVETVTAIRTKAEEIMEGVKKAFTDKIEAAKQAVKTGIDAIKKLFDIKLEFPKIKLPHFKITGNFSLNPPSVPTIGIDWYAKAMQNGMILNNPTIFGMMNGNLLGGGEAGPEVVVGAGSLFGMIQRAVGTTNYNTGGNVINVYGAPGQDVHELAQEIADIINGEITNRGAVWA